MLFLNTSFLYLITVLFALEKKMADLSFLLFYSLYIVFTLNEICVTASNYDDNSYEFESIRSALNEHTRNNFLYKDPKIDILKEDDAGELELADIIALSEENVAMDIDDYKPFDKMVIVDIHNIYRSNFTKPIPKGSDVMYVEWNNTLASAAGDWLKECQMKHGYSKDDNMTRDQGQNMYQGPSMQPSRPLYLWYEEYKNYFFHNFTCKKPYPKYQCGHILQLLWFNSGQVGCARKSNCFPKESYSILMNCHYYQPSYLNVPGLNIFKYGWPCTRCDGNFCHRGLCVSKKMCDDYKLDCECKLDCKNCVKPNYKSCRCEPCKTGWDWPDCSFPCFNAYDRDRNRPGFCSWKVKTMSHKVCDKLENLSACRKECGACKPLGLTKDADLCCGGMPCPLHYVLDESCTCKKDCPSSVCLFLDNATVEDSQFLGNKTGVPEQKEEKANISKKNRSVLINLIFLVLSIFIFNA